jgi:RNA-directed DNA polymerase
MTPIPQTHAHVAAILGMSEQELQVLRRTSRRRYRVVTITQGKKKRVLRVPDDRLKAVQRALLKSLRPILPISTAATAAPGRGSVKHAMVHRGFGWCHTCDVADCFPSIKPSLISRALRMGGLGRNAADAITDLTTVDGQLPQGAPTSNWLVDLALYDLDATMLQASAEHGTEYSRYVDDIAISARSPNRPMVRALREKLRTLRLKLRPGKSRTVIAPRKAIITGISVGATLSPHKSFLTKIREAISASLAGSAQHSDVELDGMLSWLSAFDAKLTAKLRSELASHREKRSVTATRPVRPAPSPSRPPSPAVRESP